MATNRDKLARIIAEIEEVQGDEAIGPTAFGLSMFYEGRRHEHHKS